MSISAECHSDDYKVEVSFDAVPWFKQASDDAIKALADCDWGGDYPADDVAIYMAFDNADVRRMFTYLDIVGDVGFECHVNKSEAILWLAENRLALDLEMCKTEREQIETLRNRTGECA